MVKNVIGNLLFSTLKSGWKVTIFCMFEIKITISQDSTKSKKITESKNINAKKQGPKIKSGCKKYDCLKDKNQILTDKVLVL